MYICIHKYIVSFYVTIKKIICVSCKNRYEYVACGNFVSSCGINKQDYVLHCRKRSRISYPEIINVHLRKAR